jgi:hypothetical protein
MTQPILSDPDQTTIQVIYCGTFDPNTAQDDQMWIVQCNLDEFTNLIEDPVKWVAALGKLPTWNPQVPPVLEPNFTIQIQEFVLPNQAAVDSAAGLEISVQGISKTGILSIAASRGIAQMAATRFLAQGDVVNSQAARLEKAKQTTGNEAFAATKPANFGAGPFSDLWWEFAQDPQDASQMKAMPVNVDVTNLRFYNHSQVFIPDVHAPESRGLRVASYLMAACTDPKGYVNYLQSLDRQMHYFNGKVANPGTFQIRHPGDPATVPTGNVTATVPTTNSITFLYASAEDSDQEVCDIGQGSVTTGDDGTTATITGSTTKDYD